MSSTGNNSVQIDYSCLKTELSLSLPGSQEQSDEQVLCLSLFDPKTQPNANANANAYSLNNKTRDFADTSSPKKWSLSVNGGSQCQLVIGQCANLFSHGAGAGAGGVCKKPGELKAMDIDVVASDSEKPPLSKKSTATAPKAQVIGWPPIRSFRKNSVATTTTKNIIEADGKSSLTCLYVKVSMDGAPYLRKVDLKLYNNYKELSLALRKMFSSFSVGKDGLGESHLNDLPQASECLLTYKDKDGDWMLVGDVPWGMFTSTCKRLRIMKGSEAIRLGTDGTEGRGQ